MSFRFRGWECRDVPQADECEPEEDQQLVLDAWNLAVLSRDLRERIGGEHGPAAAAIIRDIEQLSILLTTLLADWLSKRQGPPPSCRPK
jgi:hypothetical protein